VTSVGYFLINFMYLFSPFTMFVPNGSMLDFVVTFVATFLNSFYCLSVNY
jgi:hypothetical protein